MIEKLLGGWFYMIFNLINIDVDTKGENHKKSPYTANTNWGSFKILFTTLSQHSKTLTSH